MVEMLTELRRVEERLQPFIQRAHLILEAATIADYNNNVRSPLIINGFSVELRRRNYLDVNANYLESEAMISHSASII